MNTLERAATRQWLDAEVVRRILDYDPETGAFTWLYRPDGRRKWNTRYAGKPAGGVRPCGYVAIRFLEHSWYAHRIAWLWMTGEFPKGEVDHKNRIKSDNRWSNLREAAPSQNQCNKHLPLSKSGFRGVAYHSPTNKWNARIKVNGRAKSLGYFYSPEEAAAAYDKAVDVHHFGFGVKNGA